MREFSNFSVFAPFIAQGIGQWAGNTINGALPTANVAIAYLFKAEQGEPRSPLETMTPRLFYYSGTPIDITGTNPNTGNAFDFNIYSIKPTYANFTHTTYDIHFMHGLELNYSGTIGIETPAFEEFIDLGEYKPRNPAEFAFTAGTANFRLPEHSIFMTTETLGEIPWIDYLRTSAYFVCDYKNDIFPEFTKLDEVVALSIQTSTELVDIILFDDYFDHIYFSFEFDYLLNKRLNVIKQQTSDIWDAYSWPIIIILTYPLIVSLGLVQKQISERYSN